MFVNEFSKLDFDTLTFNGHLYLPGRKIAIKTHFKLPSMHHILNNFIFTVKVQIIFVLHDDVIQML